MTRILFCYPIIREEDNPKHAPFGMSILAAVCEREGAQVAFYDMNAARSVLSRNEVFKELVDVAQEGYDIVACGGLTTTYSCVKQVGKLLRPILPDALFVMGGNLLTSLPNEIMTWLPEYDIGAVGDAWETIADILTRSHDRNWEGVKGVVWRKEHELKINPIRPPIQNVDALPFPAWHLLPMEVYFRNSSILLSEASWTAKKRCDVATSFGCPLRCHFCLNESMIGELGLAPSKWNKTDVDFSWKGHRVYHFHSTDYIIREIRDVERKLWNVAPQGPIDYVAFLDENWVTSSDVSGTNRIKEIADAWIDAGFQPLCVRDGMSHDPEKCHGKHVTATSHAGRIREDLLRDMQRMGVSVLDYGLESFNMENMKEMAKGSTPHLNIRAVRMTMSYGIRPCPNQILNFPTESFMAIRDNMAAWKELGVVVYPFMCTPFPGTHYFTAYRDRIQEQYGGDLELFIMDLGDCTKPTATISDFTIEEITKIREWMVKDEREAIDKYENIWRKRHDLTPLTPEQQSEEWKNAELRAADPRGKWPPEQEPIPVQASYKPEHVKIRG